ncbi:hypothetical protein PINS_up020545 [Pythium insidiosum]|nr:hypothetical protein PINS_up020545 [Pythium insidiosum]
MLCTDLPPATAVSPRIGFDYARKLLRLQLNGMLQEVSPADVEFPALNRTLRWPIGRFHLQQQWLSPVALQYFLWKADAQGFLGVGYAHRPRASLLWTALQNDSSQYLYDRRSSNATAGVEESDEERRHTALSTIRIKDDAKDASSRAWDWSEPCASVDQADDQGSNNQGITFPLHRLGFACRQAKTIHRVDMFGEFSGYWDAVVDLNAACLSLPQQFYDSLAGWIGFTYNEERKVTEFPAASALPSLLFSLTFDGRSHVVPLERLVLRNASTTSASTAWVCIQRGASIMQNGASMFSALDSDTTSAQRYRLHGSMSLPLYNMAQVPIIFGHMMLQAMGAIVVDGDAKQVAFPRRKALDDTTDAGEEEEDEKEDEDDRGRREVLQTAAMCHPVKQCVGQQLYVPRLNACLDPDCSLYYFQSLDPTTKRCTIVRALAIFIEGGANSTHDRDNVFSVCVYLPRTKWEQDTSWLQVVGSLLAVFVSLELGFSIGMRRMIQRAVDAANPNDDDVRS